MLKPLCRIYIGKDNLIHLCYGDKEIVADGVIIDDVTLFKGKVFVSLKTMQDDHPNCRLHTIMEMGDSTLEDAIKYIPGYGVTAEVRDFPEDSRCLKCGVL